MKRLVALALVLMLAACASIEKVEGDQLVNNRLVLKVPQAWNRMPANDGQPFQTWTQEGLAIDHLRFWAAIKPGEALRKGAALRPGPNQQAPRVPTYTKGMTLDQLVNLFEIVYAADGSTVAMTKVEPAGFAGAHGVRFEFSVVRKGDDVMLLGLGWAAVHKDELFAASFVAPRLSFFKRLAPMARDLVATASVKN
jgi:hypothetical protein